METLLDKFAAMSHAERLEAIKVAAAKKEDLLTELAELRHEAQTLESSNDELEKSIPEKLFDEQLVALEMNNTGELTRVIARLRNLTDFLELKNERPAATQVYFDTTKDVVDKVHNKIIALKHPKMKDEIFPMARLSKLHALVGAVKDRLDKVEADFKPKPVQPANLDKAAAMSKVLQASPAQGEALVKVETGSKPKAIQPATPDKAATKDKVLQASPAQSEGPIKSNRKTSATKDVSFVEVKPETTSTGHSTVTGPSTPVSTSKKRKIISPSKVVESPEDSSGGNEDKKAKVADPSLLEKPVSDLVRPAHPGSPTSSSSSKTLSGAGPVDSPLGSPTPSRRTRGNTQSPGGPAGGRGGGGGRARGVPRLRGRGRRGHTRG